MRLSLSFLGSFQATCDSSPLKGFESDKVRALLAYLVVEAGQPHRRDLLAAMFWPEQPQEVALKNLRHVVYKLRQVLGEADADKPAKPAKPAATQVSEAPYLLVTTQAVQFNSAADFAVDVTEFTELIEACRTHTHRRIEVCRACHLRLKRAAELYRGNFLAGFGLADSIEFEEWMLLQREALRHRALETFVQLTAYSKAREDYSQALHYARRQLELEPWREEAYRLVIELLATTGQRNAALLEYETCRRVLAEELGVEPEAETRDLYERVKVGALAAQTPAHQASRHNLPVVLTPFIGREEELAKLEELLQAPHYRLVTLTGPGGVGKTRLAAQAQVGAFHDGVFFVPLVAVSSPDLLALTIASATGLTLQSREDPTAQLLSYLAAKELFLVLDNFEHLMEGADLVLDILKRAPQVNLLVTSREVLSLQAEFVFELEGLPYPGSDPAANDTAPHDETPGTGFPLDAGTAAGYAAVQLFVERAQRVQRAFSLAATDVGEVVRICRLVAGMPLALELAAARVGNYPQPPGTLRALGDAISGNLDFLAATFRDIPPQHRSLRAVFDYSWALLSNEERAAFSGLSVFHGGFDREAAGEVVGIDAGVLEALSRQSLLQRTPEGRYELHELLRQYASEHLGAAPGSQVLAQARHAGYYLALAEQIKPSLSSSEQKQQLDLLEREHNNLRAALSWAKATRHDGAGDDGDQWARRTTGLRLIGALWQFWVVRGYAREGWEQASALLAVEPSLRAKLASECEPEPSLQQGAHAQQPG